MSNCIKCSAALPEGALFCPACGKKQMKTTANAVPAPKYKKPPNGSGTVYKRGNAWQVEYRVYTGKTIASRKTKGGFATKREAMEWLAEIKQAKIMQKSMRVVEAWELLQKTQSFQKLSKDKQSHYKKAWERVKPIAGMEIGVIPFAALQRLVDGVQGGYYPKRDVKALLGKLWEMAVKNEALEPGQDKTAQIELPSVPKSTKDAFTPDEVQKMWAACLDGDYMARLGIIMIYTGMRPGELLQLRISNIDLERRVAIGGIKTKAGIDREIPIANAIIPLLTDLMENASSDFIVRYQKGHFNRLWGEMAKKTGIRQSQKPHSCRHTTATAMEQAGISPLIRKLILGHSSGDITDRYTHISLQQKIDAIEKTVKNFDTVANTVANI